MDIAALLNKSAVKKSSKYVRKLVDAYSLVDAHERAVARAHGVVAEVVELQNLRMVVDGDEAMRIRQDEFDILDAAEQDGVELGYAGVSADWREAYK